MTTCTVSMRLIGQFIFFKEFISPFDLPGHLENPKPFESPYGAQTSSYEVQNRLQHNTVSVDSPARSRGQAA